MVGARINPEINQIVEETAGESGMTKSAVIEHYLELGIIGQDYIEDLEESNKKKSDEIVKCARRALARWIECQKLEKRVSMLTSDGQQAPFPN